MVFIEHMFQFSAMMLLIRGYKYCIHPPPFSGCGLVSEHVVRSHLKDAIKLDFCTK